MFISNSSPLLNVANISSSHRQILPWCLKTGFRNLVKTPWWGCLRITDCENSFLECCNASFWEDTEGWWSVLNTLCSPARQMLMQCQALVWTQPLSELKPQLCSLLPEVFGGFLSYLHTLRGNSVFLMWLFRAWSSTWYIINVPGGQGAPKLPNWLHPGSNFSCHWDVSLTRVGVCVSLFPYSNRGW